LQCKAFDPLIDDEPLISSREILVFVEQLPDTSRTKTAMREEDWSEQEYIHARIANELMLSRADYAASQGSKMSPNVILSPAQRQSRDEDRALQSELHHMMIAQMTGEFVPPARDIEFRHVDDREE